MALEILHLTPYYEEAWGYGGIPRVASALCRALARRGHRVTVCTTDARDRGGRLTPAAGVGPWLPWAVTRDAVEVRYFPNLSNQLAYHGQLFLPLGLRSFLRRLPRRVDVAHIHACHNLLGVAAAAELRRHRVPYVLQPNGTAPTGIERRRWAKWLFDVTAGRRVLPGAERVIAVTAAEQQQLLDLGVPGARVRIVPNPIDLTELEPLPARGGFRQRFAAGFRRLVLYLGRLSPRKNVDVLIRSLLALGDDSVGLAIAGNDMGSGATLRALVWRCGLGNRVRFVGQLDGRDRLAAYVDADAVVYPGRDEVFGLVALEALLCGAPVVVADDSGCAEVVTRVGGGRIAPPGDVSALAAALRDVLEHGDSWRLAAAEARCRIRERFAADVVAAAVEQVYGELAERAS